MEDFGESNIVVFTITAVFIQTFNGTNFFILFEEPRQLREVNNEEPTEYCRRTRNSAFHNKDEAPPSILTGVNPRQAVRDDTLISEQAEIDDTEKPEAKILDI